MPYCSFEQSDRAPPMPDGPLARVVIRVREVRTR
jgi:hypothetical protein